ncbi:U1 snRNP protein [Paramarasmius palmivorus]|uniref:U1 snRNP protein n=1 Tax=Paramarasmius palmivorus TaxID=297713 RepID=A0AAW0DY92_9AGAR
MNWTEHRNPEGRTYWFNTATKESVWEKPDELKTPFERALNQTKWKEYFSGGRKYYYNTETKESKWDMPDELLLVLEKVEKEGAAKAPTATPGAITAPGFTPVTGSGSEETPGQQNGTELAVGPHTGGLPLSSSSVLPARPNLPDDPVIPHNGFATVEEGEKAFTHLLRKAGVDANWTWDQTMRAIITDPLYKALNTLAEKKAVFEKYTTNLKVKEAEEKEARLAKLRPAIRNMLKGNPNVFHYSTFATADKLFSQHPIWQQAKIESERRLIFEEYVAELKQREVQESRAARARSTAKVVNLFKELDVDVLTRWATAYKRLTETEEWENDPDLQVLPKLDILLAFEDYSRVREREYEEQMRRAQVEKTRRERKAREAFKDLLQGLVDSGKIKARTKWKEVYPLFKDDERYINMLGNPGSNQLELFWDVVDALDQKLDEKIAVVMDAVKRSQPKSDDKSESAEGDGEPEKGYTVGPESAEEEFMNVVRAADDDEVKKLSDGDLHEIFNTLHATAVRKKADEKRRAERKLRHLQDDLRYALRKLPDPLELSLSYEAAVPLMEHLPEYKAIEDEEARRNAFAKFVKRQKERLREANSEDGGSTTSRKRKEPSRDDRDHRDRDRDRERDRDRDRERDRDRDRERSYRDKGKDYDRDGRDSRHHSRYDDYDRSRKGSRSDYASDRDRDRDRDYKSSRHSRDDRDDRRRDRDRDRERDKDRRSDHAKDWEDSRRRSDRDKSVSSTYREETSSRDKRDLDDKSDDRVEKRPRLDSDKASSVGREDTPEEGEI